MSPQSFNVPDKGYFVKKIDSISISFEFYLVCNYFHFHPKDHYSFDFGKIRLLKFNLLPSDMQKYISKNCEGVDYIDTRRLCILN